MTKKRINVIGVHQKIEAYPNTLFLLEELNCSGKFDIKEYNMPMWSGSLSSKKNLLSKVNSLFKAIAAHLKVIFYLFKLSKKEYVYIPYPATFVALSLLLLPKSKKPKKVVIDAFISIYDTAIIDRKLFPPKSYIARLLKKIERVAFKQAHIVITDTLQNSQHYAHTFGLPISKFKSIPLATDETHFNKIAYSHQSIEGVFNIIFIGTLIPLHGIDTIIRATELLADNECIQFTIIGDGQMSSYLKAKIINGRLKNINWITQWQSSKELVGHLVQANLALGIFGTGDKTQRVCPFKLYAYMRCGLPIITGKTSWSTQILKEIDYLPLVTVPVGNAEKLSSAIVQCYESEEFCSELTINSYRYYHESLANKNAIQQFDKCF